MISISSESGSLHYLKGTIDHLEAERCKATLNSYLESRAGESIDIDLSGLETVSSITLSFLLYGLRSAKQHSCHFNYKNMPPDLFNMARVSGIESILVNISE